MPFEIDYTDSAGVLHNNSFWVLRNINIDHLGRVASLLFNGYVDVAAYEAGSEPFAQETVNFLDSGVYDSYLGNPLVTPSSSFSYYWYIETAVPVATDFFTPNTQFSAVRAVSLEVGSGGSLVVKVSFPNAAHTGMNENGVTINVNGSPATISSSTTSSAGGLLTVEYTLSAAIDPNDDVEWEYDSSTGTMTDPGVLPFHDQGPRTVVNEVGSYMHFNDLYGSIWNTIN